MEMPDKIYAGKFVNIGNGNETIASDKPWSTSVEYIRADLVPAFEGIAQMYENEQLSYLVKGEWVKLQTIEKALMQPAFDWDRPAQDKPRLRKLLNEPQVLTYEPPAPDLSFVTEVKNLLESISQNNNLEQIYEIIDQAIYKLEAVGARSPYYLIGDTKEKKLTFSETCNPNNWSEDKL
jgi:hypothetical protein